MEKENKLFVLIVRKTKLRVKDRVNNYDVVTF